MQLSGLRFLKFQRQPISTMYIYYGKSNVATTSNGNATFEFFDDFSGNLSKWDPPVGGTLADSEWAACCSNKWFWTAP